MSKRFTKFSRDERGNVAIITGVSIVGVLIGVGAAVDYSIASGNASQAQNIADSLSLAAAIAYVENDHEVPKAGEFYAQGVTYTPDQLGYEFAGLAEGSQVSITFQYDLNSNQVVAHVSGDSKTTFSSIVGKEKLPFSTRSVSLFPGKDLSHPASIAMVIDNSNSMYYDENPSAAWDQKHYDQEYKKFRKNKNHDEADALARQEPTGKEKRPSDTTQRIVSLKAAMRNFNTYLDDAIGGDEDQRYLRMGLIPFNHDFIKDKRRNMNWGIIPENKISGMSPSGETDTSRGMDQAQNFLKNEHSRYDSEIRDALKRYVILMTDGNDSVDRSIQVDSPGSGLWRGQVRRTRQAGWRSSSDCTRYETRYRDRGEGGRQSYRACTKRGPKKKHYQEAKEYWQWQNIRQRNRPTEGRGWKEIEYQNRTRHRCDQFKAAGWDVFTVGYALKPGYYQRNLPGRPPREFWGFSPDDIKEATSLLQYCATTPDHFILAKNASELNTAFEDIAASIADDTAIRITN